MSLSFYHSSGHFTKRCFSARPLNFVFISTIAFLIFMQEVVYALSLLMANCAWLTSSFLCENIGYSALHNRLVFLPLDVIPSASTFLLSCLPYLPFTPHTTWPAAASLLFIQSAFHSPHQPTSGCMFTKVRGCCSGRALREPTTEPVGWGYSMTHTAHLFTDGCFCLLQGMQELLVHRLPTFQ